MQRKRYLLEEINWHKEHIHCLISLGKDQSISKVSQLIKCESSKWINDKINVERENRITTLVLHPGYESIDEYFDVGAESMHFSYGAGLRIAMNQNFVIAVDYGFAADERDGDSGLYIGLNYLF